MRILVVNYEYPPLGGGGGVLTRTLVRSLARDHDVCVLTSRALDLPAESYEDHARVLRAPVLGRRDPNRASLPSLAAFLPAVRLRAARVLARWVPDIVHTFFAIPSGPAGAWAARRAGAPHVLTLIGADVHDPTRSMSPDRFAPLRRAVRRVVARADAVTAISSDIARRATELCGRTDITVVPCAVDSTPLPPRDRASLGWAEDETVIVAVGRLVRRKGIDALLRAAGRAGRTARLRLEVIGDGPERDALSRLAAQAGVRAVFAGSLTVPERDRRLASADVFALPSHHEGFGLAIVEAMRAGLPVVTTSAGGPPDFVAEGVSGYLVAPGDEAALAERLARLAADPAERARMGSAAREAATRLVPERMAAEYLAVYERVRRPGARAGAP